MTGWTIERIDLLRRFHAEGLSCSEIAARLQGGLSRNAVIGKIHRLKLPARKATPVRPVNPRRDGQKETVASLHALGLSWPQIALRMGITIRSVYGIAKQLGLKGHKQQQSENQRVRARIERIRCGADKVSASAANAGESFVHGFAGQQGRLSIIDLTPASCRFPIDMPDGAVRFCGDTIEEGTPYCQHHAARCLNGTPVKKKPGAPVNPFILRNRAA